MRLDAWVWQLRDDYPGADNDDTHLPIARMWLKTHESSRWFTTEQIARLVDVYRQQDIAMAAWCVPTGLADDTGLAIAVLNDLHAAGIAEPWLQFDVEVEPGAFWQGGNRGLLPQIFTNVKAACPWAKLALCVYQWDNRLFGIDDTAPLADLLVSMSYWTQFGTQPEEQLAGDYRHLSFYGRPVQMGLPGNATPGQMVRGLEWCKTTQPPTDPVPIIWRRGTTTGATWQAIESFTWEEPPPPEPVPPPDHETQDLIDALTISRDAFLTEADAAVKIATDVQNLANRLRAHAGGIDNVLGEVSG